MLEIQRIRSNTAYIIERVTAKGLKNAQEIVTELIEWDDKRKNTLLELERLRAEGNQIAKEIGILMSQGKHEEAKSAKIRTGDAKEQVKFLENYKQE